MKRGKPLARTPFKPRTEPMRPKAGVKRVAIRPRNHKRRDRLWEMQFGSREFVAWVKQQPCACCGERGPCDAAHVAKSRGAGGTWKDIAPLKPACHRREHQLGSLTFWRTAKKDPARVAAEYQARWKAAQGAFA